MGKDVIIACDFPGAEECLEFLEIFSRDDGAMLRKPYVKVGMELFYSAGPQIIEKIKSMGYKIFLDLKLHDIPNTVKGAMASLSRLDVDMCNVHAAGGIKMMKAAVEGLTREDGTRPLLIAVTQLTSTSQEVMQKELLIDRDLEDVVIEYARNTKEAVLDGVVCSPMEAAKIKEACGEDFLTVTPGIRFDTSNKQDQVRVTTPAMAKELKSDYIVVGRSITKDEEPYSAYKRCVEEFI